MAIIKKFQSFVSERIEESSIAVATVKPKKALSDDVSSDAAAQKVIDRFESIYHKSSKEEKEEINSYFEK